MKLSISFLKSNYDIKKTIAKISKTDCDFIHVDVMDGLFVKNKTDDLLPYLNNTKKRLDIHLMVENPIDYINTYKSLNPEYITIHVEIKQDLDFLINYLKSLNIKVGLAINPDTSLNLLEPYLSKIDQILVMSVYPGAGGQKFMESSLEKIALLRKLKDENNYLYLINIDGGVNDIIAKNIKLNKADMLVSGSFVCCSNNYQEQINKLKGA